METNTPTVNHPSFILCCMLSEDGFKDETYFVWEYLKDVGLLWTIPATEKKRIVSERYVPKPTWNEVLEYLITKYEFKFDIQVRSSLTFRYNFMDTNGTTFYGSEVNLHNLYEKMVTEFIITLKR